MNLERIALLIVCSLVLAACTTTSKKNARYLLVNDHYTVTNTAYRWEQTQAVIDGEIRGSGQYLAAIEPALVGHGTGPRRVEACRLIDTHTGTWRDVHCDQVDTDHRNIRLLHRNQPWAKDAPLRAPMAGLPATLPGVSCPDTRR